jgi:hypothetical protein
MQKEPLPTPPRRILSIDGGGIRCLMGVEILAALEQRLAQAAGDPQRRLCQQFDLVAGTSGGALVATAIALGASMQEVRDFVVTNARQMFRPSRWRAKMWSMYDGAGLERNMQDWFGVDTTLGSDRLRTLLLLVMRNWSTDSPWLVSNNPNAPFNSRALDDCNLDLPLWQLARASAAAPAYYVPQSIRFGRQNPYDFVFVDGGLTGFLNPAFKAFQYATTQPYGIGWPAGESELVVVSVGSGEARLRRMNKPAREITIVEALRGLPGAMLQATVREQDLLCRTFGRCITGAPIDLEVGDLQHAETAVEPRRFRYHRLSPPLTEAGLNDLGCGDINPHDVTPLDAVHQVEALSRIGRAYAARWVDRVCADCLDPGVSAGRAPGSSAAPPVSPIP